MVLVLPLNYHCPDGEPHYINNELFVYPSYDYSKGGYCSNKLFVAHSKDLSKWVIDGPAFESSKLDWENMPCYPAGLPETNTYEELPNYIKDYLPKHMEKFIPFKWFKGYLMWIMEKLQGKDISKRLLYAPDSITIGDKSYLFFCTSDDCEGVAVSNDPAGPFEYHRSTGNSRYLRRICAEPIHIDGNAMFSAIGYEGNGELDLSYKVDKSGELTIYMETKRQVEIKSFILQ